MSNHYHVVLHVNLAEVEALTDLEVIERWCGLFKGTMLTESYRQGEALTQAESKVVFDRIQEWRERLTDISWFIRCCNEWLARESNKEDLCTGRFWGQFFSPEKLSYTTSMWIKVGLSPKPYSMKKH